MSAAARAGCQLTMEPEALYLQLGQLIAEMPTLGGHMPITPDINRWLGRAAYLGTQTGVGMDPISFSVASDALHSSLRDLNAQQISAIVYRAFAFAEANAPSSARGGFVGVHQDLDALQRSWANFWRKRVRTCSSWIRTWTPRYSQTLVPRRR